MNYNYPFVMICKDFKIVDVRNDGSKIFLKEDGVTLFEIYKRDKEIWCNSPSIWNEIGQRYDLSKNELTKFIPYALYRMYGELIGNVTQFSAYAVFLNKNN